MKTEYTGDILSVRAVEDCIRATKNYTKDVFRRAPRHPVQGEDFPSKVFTEHYEVYPDTTICWDMPVADAIDWAWGEVSHVDITFWYSYPTNRAKITIGGGNGILAELYKGIPNLRRELSKLSMTSDLPVRK